MAIHVHVHTQDAAGSKVSKVMHEFKHGTLHSGSKKGPKVKSRKQAIAIGLSKQRRGDGKDDIDLGRISATGDERRRTMSGKDQVKHDPKTGQFAGSGTANKPSRSEAAKHVHEIKQKMIRTGNVRPDHATAHLPEPMKSAVIHGIVHGTNTLGFREKTHDYGTSEGAKKKAAQSRGASMKGFAKGIGGKVIPKRSGAPTRVKVGQHRRKPIRQPV